MLIYREPNTKVLGFSFLIYMKKVLLITLIVSGVIISGYQLKSIKQSVEVIAVRASKEKYIIKEGETIKSRVRVPLGYKRVTYAKGTFQDYLRHYRLDKFGTKIINYDGSEYYWQNGHIGILDIPVPENGLQQCADALIRIRSEYLWDNNRKNEIGFNFTSGHYCSWLKYAEGYRPQITGNNVIFNKTASINYSKENFYRYLKLIYMYSGTLSLYNELQEIDLAINLKIGDMLIKGGTPGHIVMICDAVINANGDKLYLLFQGNTPAQNVHLVKNLEDTEISPWYGLEKNAIISVSNYTFYNAEFVRFK